MSLPRILCRPNSITLGVMLLGLLYGCTSTKNVEKGSGVAYQQLAQWVDAKEFTVQSDWAMPLRGSRVNLIGNPNYLTFKNDSVEVFLPYFGVRQMMGGYGSSGGITFEGVPKNLLIDKKETDQEIEIEFEGAHQSENFQFYITLYKSKRATISVNTPYRDNIRYQGFVKKLAPEDAQQ